MLVWLVGFLGGGEAVFSLSYFRILNSYSVCEEVGIFSQTVGYIYCSKIILKSVVCDCHSMGFYP